MQDDDDLPPPSWRQRPKPLGQEMAYRLDGAFLEVETLRRQDRVDLAQVESVRFFHAPSNITSRSFRTELRLADGRRVTFGNLSWRSLTDIDRDDPRYRRFVSALAQAIAKANPKARFVAGKPFSMWLILAVAGVLALVLFGWFSARAFSQGATGAGWLGIVFALASAWQVWPMVRLNKPRELAAGEVPPELVPGGT